MAEVRLTNPDRVYFPAHGVTKSDVRDYLARVAPQMLPHAAHRPLSLVRCPSGIGDSCFFQKHRTDGLPEPLRSVEVREAKGGRKEYLYIDDAEGLAACAQIGALELHPWGARVEDLEHPERVIFDLDPDEGLGFAEVISAARAVRDVLAACGLNPFAMLSGGKGVHVIAPLRPRAEWPEVKDFCRTLAQVLAVREPERFVAEASKARRRGRIFVDWMRNQRGQTSVCPFSVRARPGAPVATPIRWQELGRAKSGAEYTTRTLPRRLRALRRDPWDGYFAAAEPLSPAALRTLRTAL